MEEIILSISKVPEVYMGYGQKQVQSDWNATNTTDPAYIKNKPTGMATETYVNEAVNGLASEIYVDNAVSEGYTSLDTSIQIQLETKVDKVDGKGLSTNDYTTEEKAKLSGIADGAEVNVQSDWNVSDSGNDAYIANKPNIHTDTVNINSDIVDGSLTVGENVMSSEYGSFCSGGNNSVLTSRGAVVGGFNNTVGYAASDCAIVVGNNNDIQQSQYAVIIGGTNNTIGADCFQSIIIGGIANLTTAENQVVLGKYSNPTVDDAFAIGNGVSGTPSNALRVTWGGEMYTNDGVNGEKKIATEEFVANAISTALANIGVAEQGAY